MDRVLTYERYISSRAWAKRRDAYFTRHPRRCRACGRKTDLHLHHVTYERMGAEPDSDLVSLCQPHHDLVHAMNRLSPTLTLRESTEEVLRSLATKGKKKRGWVKGTTPRPVIPFVPANQRLTLAERGALPMTGRDGRLSGIPIVVVPRTPRAD